MGDMYTDTGYKFKNFNQYYWLFLQKLEIRVGYLEKNDQLLC